MHGLRLARVCPPGLATCKDEAFGILGLVFLRDLGFRVWGLGVWGFFVKLRLSRFRVGGLGVRLRGQGV